MLLTDVSTNEKRSMLDVLHRVRAEADIFGYDNVEVWIGTDSQNHTHHTIFSTVLIIYRRGKGGKIFRIKNRVPTMRSVRQRMIQEAYESIRLAKLYEDVLVEANMVDLIDIKMVVHIDVNPDENFESNRALKEIMGWLWSNGIQNFEIKPLSPAATFAADRYVH